MVLDEGKFGDALKTLNRTAHHAVNTIDYIKGKRDSKYNFVYPSKFSDIKKTELNGLMDYKFYDSNVEAKKDPADNMLQLKFDARKVPANLASKINPQGDLYKYVKSYDPKDYTITMEIPMNKVNNGESPMTVKIPKKSTKKTESYSQHESDSRYLYEKSKSVLDSDGFYTDYTMYLDTETGNYIFIFGDNDIYSPEDTEPDWECETEEEANEYFDEYNGFEDDLDESVMTPTPVPYRGLVCDKDGKLIKNGKKVIESISGDILNKALNSYETDNWMDPSEFENNEDYDEYYSYQDMGPEQFYREYKDILDFSPEFSEKYGSEIYECFDICEAINSSFNQPLDKDIVSLFKQNIIVKDSIEESVKPDQLTQLEGELRDKLKETLIDKFNFEEDDITDHISLKITDHNEDGIKIEIKIELNDDEDYLTLSSDLDEVLKKYDEYAYFELSDSGNLEAILWNDLKEESLTEDKSKEKKFSFKDAHICDGCGQPLSSCTCDIQTEDFSGATQPSSIGQHKRSSIDLIEDEN